MNRSKWEKLDKSLITGYFLAIEEEHSIVAGVRLAVEMASGRRYFLNNTLYSSVGKAARALPNVLEKLNS